MDIKKIPYYAVMIEKFKKIYGYSEKKAVETVKIAYDRELEDLFPVREFLMAGINNFAKEFGLENFEKEELIIEVFESDSNEYLTSLGNEIRKMTSREGDILSPLVLSYLRAVHEKYISKEKDNIENSSDIYKYLPLELIGFDNVLEYLYLIGPIISKMEVFDIYNLDLVRSEYEKSVVVLLQKIKRKYNSEVTDEVLIDYISNLEHFKNVSNEVIAGIVTILNEKLFSDKHITTKLKNRKIR